MKGTRFVFAFALLVVTSFAAHAVPVQWDFNGHWYDINSDPLEWHDAKVAAETMSFSGLSGHLVTITSQQENDWLFSTFPVLSSDTFHWIGAFQPDASLLDQGWTWVTGEPWSYENWAQNEPNDFFATDPGVMMFEDVVHFFPPGGTQWADTISTIQFPSVVEFAPPYTIPEPGTGLLFVCALAGLVAVARNRLRPRGGDR